MEWRNDRAAKSHRSISAQSDTLRRRLLFRLLCCAVSDADRRIVRPIARFGGVEFEPQKISRRLAAV